jgi:glutathione S-transferase
MGATTLTNANGLELYHFDRSSAARKVRIALAEKGLPWQSHLLNTSVDQREQFKPEYLALNPRGVVPTLIHNGKAIRESQVILEYLEDEFPEPALRPADPFGRARMRLWTKLADEGMHSQNRTLAMCIYMGDLNSAAGADAVAAYYAAMPEAQRRQNDLTNIEYGLNSPLLAGAVTYYKQIFNEIEDATARDPWLAGEDYSLADITIGVYVTRLAGLGMAPLWESLSGLRDWYDRFTARPAYVAGVHDWGDHSSAHREEHAAAAFPVIKTLWESA